VAPVPERSLCSGRGIFKKTLPDQIIIRLNKQATVLLGRHRAMAARFPQYACACKNVLWFPCGNNGVAVLLVIIQI
jgi:hypothetical protein